MVRSALPISRRQAAIALAVCLAAGAARADSGGGAPLRIACARLGPEGFVRIDSEEQAIWRRMELRLGGLVDRLTLLRPADLLAPAAPAIDGPATARLALLSAASAHGADHAILYTCDDGRKTFPHSANWFSSAFASARGVASRADPAQAEAALMHTTTGADIAFVSGDAPPRDRLNPFDNHRRPDREAVEALTGLIEREIMEMMTPAFARSRSIAD
ncbi:hypothetical protein GC169_03020 [bacterium]|nr:hypothetical protein [bacterium]